VVKPVRITHHTSLIRGTYRDDHGTPNSILDLVRAEYGGIDLDLASNAVANETVLAKQFYTLENPCPDTVPLQGIGTVWCNPPGPLTNVEKFWNIWLDCICFGIDGGFLIYNIDHWRCLTHSFESLYVLVLRKRIKFMGAKHGASFPSVLVFSSEPKTLAIDTGHLLEWRGVI
jgi:hypothetical protein